MEADPIRHKNWFTRPAADAKVIDRGSRTLYVALSQEAVFALGHIQAALGKLAAGDCDITKPMDEAHTLIGAAHVDVGKALKVLRSLLP